MTGGLAATARRIAFWKLEDWRVRLLAGLVIGVIAVAARNRGILLPAGDLFTYWDLDVSQLYVTSTVGVGWSYLYSPAFAQVLEPLRAVPWPVIEAAYTILLTTLLALGAGWVGIVGLAIPGVLGEIIVGNIQIPLGAAIAVGLTRPAAWALVLLTKVTPGIGLIWFLVRREWRRLAVALGVTGAIVAVSFVLDPQAWFDWIGVLSANQAAANVYSAVALPLPVRLVLSGIVVVIAARRDWPWLVPGACGFALPILWPGWIAMALFGFGLLPKTPVPANGGLAAEPLRTAAGAPPS